MSSAYGAWRWVAHVAALLAGAASFTTPCLSANPELIEMTAAEFRKQDGIWRSRGYGWIWEAKNGRIQTYDVTNNFCMKHVYINDLPGTLMPRVWMDKSKKIAKLSLDDQAYLYTFDRIDAVPGNCRQPGQSTPQEAFDAMVESYSSHYSFFKERGVDWFRHVNAIRPKLNHQSDRRQLFATLSELIAPIDDAHVRISAFIDSEEFYFRPRRQRTQVTPEDRARAMKTTGYWTKNIGQVLLGDRAISVGDGRIKYGLLNDDVGIIVLGSSGGTLRRLLGPPLNAVFTKLKDTKALILDISRNYGGTDVAARELTRSFIDERTIGYYRYAADYPGEQPQSVYIEPSEGLRYTKPIFMITSRTSISAAELIVLVMRGLPHVTHIGEPTRGSMSEVLTKKLPNGWNVTVSNEVYLDRDHKGWEGYGIPPDIEVPVVTESKPGKEHIEAANKLVEFIRARVRD